MAWCSDVHFRDHRTAPACFDCDMYQHRIDGGWSEHCCSIDKPDFPNAGEQCPAYQYDPGSDKAEYMQ